MGTSSEPREAAGLSSYDSIAFRYIAANTHPDHDTLAHFRRRFGAQFEQLLVQVLMPAREMGMLKLGKVSVGGSKIKANASKHRALSWGHLQKIEKQLQQEVRQLMALAESEDRKNVPDGMEVPKEIALRQERLAVLDEAKRMPAQLLADTGYCSAANVNACVASGIEPLIAMKRAAHHLPVLARFTEPPPLAADADVVAQMAHRLKTKSGRADDGLRKQTVEPVFGIIKHVVKFRQFMVRGLAPVGHEWNLVALAWNLKRMMALEMV